MYCKNCGQNLDDTARWCPACGTKQEVETVQAEPVSDADYFAAPPTAPQPPVAPHPPVDFMEEKPADKGGFLWGLLGYLVPLVGLILFLVWKDTKPKTSKAAGIGALVSVILGVIVYIIAIVGFVSLGVVGMY